MRRLTKQDAYLSFEPGPWYTENMFMKHTKRLQNAIEKSGATNIPVPAKRNDAVITASEPQCVPHKIPAPSSWANLETLQKLIPPEWEDGFDCLLEQNLYALRAQTLSINVQNIIHQPQPPTARTTGTPRLTSAIDPAELESRLMHKLDKERLYLRDDLTLSMLAHALDIEPHQLTCFLNHYLQTSFRHLINTYRINAAKDCLIYDPHATVLDIAYQVGFNSKASFNRAFKKLTGLTPTQFRIRTQTQIAT
jgi:AraC-like DNA-binding protein